MNSFFALVKFEYKKILRKRSSIIALILGIIVIIFASVADLIGDYCVNGEKTESNYEFMKKNREHDRALAGREVNSDLLSEAVEAYSRIPLNGTRYIDTDEYQQYARKYNGIFSLIDRMYDIRSLDELSSIKKGNLDDFYSLRQKLVENNINASSMNSREKANSISISRKVKTPFVYSYTFGYVKYLVQMNAIALIICFICSVCLAPLFSGEYTDRMDSLILASKYGKNKIICAKLFTGISFCMLLSTIYTFASYITVMTAYGWDGSNAPIQLYDPMLSIPFTMGKAAFLYSLIVIFANMLSSSLTMVLSAKLKNPFLVIVIMTVVTMAPCFINASENKLWLYHLFNLIPSQMFNIYNVINDYSIGLPGMIIQPYILLISFAIAASIVLLPLAYRSFKNHE